MKYLILLLLFGCSSPPNYLRHTECYDFSSSPRERCICEIMFAFDEGLSSEDIRQIDERCMNE